MKRFFCAVLSAVMVLSMVGLCACGNAAEEGSATASEEVSLKAESEVAETPEPVDGDYLGSINASFSKEKVFEVPFPVITSDEESKLLVEYDGVTVELVTDQKTSITDVRVSDGEGNMKNIEIDCVLVGTFRTKIDNETYDGSDYYFSTQPVVFDIVDYYSGTTYGFLTTEDNFTDYEYGDAVTVDGKSYHIGYTVTKDFEFEYGDWDADETEDGLLYEYYDTTATTYLTYYIQIDKDYDGLVLALNKKSGLNYDSGLYYENLAPENRLLFEADEAGNTYTADDYYFVKLSDL